MSHHTSSSSSSIWCKRLFNRYIIRNNYTDESACCICVSMIFQQETPILRQFCDKIQQIMPNRTMTTFMMIQKAVLYLG